MTIDWPTVRKQRDTLARIAAAYVGLREGADLSAIVALLDALDPEPPSQKEKRVP